MPDVNFLGSRVDLGAEQLPEQYELLHSKVARIRQQWLRTSAADRTEELAKECYQRAQRLMVLDEHGNKWTVSLATLRWKVMPQGKSKWRDGHPLQHV